jgi:hypothetical protein
MIVQEHIEGIRGNDLAAIDNAGLDRKVLAIRPGIPSDRARQAIHRPRHARALSAGGDSTARPADA